MPPSSPTTVRFRAPVSDKSRWIRLAACIVCMVATANVQHAWALFVPEIEHAYGWSRARIPLSFTLFVVVQTYSVCCRAPSPLSPPGFYGCPGPPNCTPRPVLARHVARSRRLFEKESLLGGAI